MNINKKLHTTELARGVSYHSFRKNYVKSTYITLCMVHIFVCTASCFHKIFLQVRSIVLNSLRYFAMISVKLTFVKWFHEIFFSCTLVKPLMFWLSSFFVYFSMMIMNWRIFSWTKIPNSKITIRNYRPRKKNHD